MYHCANVFSYLTCLLSGLVLPLYLLFNLLLFTLLSISCLHDLNAQHLDLVHVCLLVHAIWLHFTHSLGCFSDNLCMSRSRSLDVVDPFRGGSLLNERVVDRRRSSVARFFQPPLNRFSRFSITAREHLPILYFVNHLVYRTFVLSGDVIFL